MDTTSETKPHETDALPRYKHITGILWAGYDSSGTNFHIGTGKEPAVKVERADLDDLRTVLGPTVAKAPSDYVARTALAQMHERIDALVEGRSEAMRLIADRMEALEKRVQTNYDYVTQRLNKTDETVGINYRGNREEHTQIAAQFHGDGTDGNPGIKHQIAELAMLVDGVNTAQENLQGIVEKLGERFAPGSAKHVELPPNVATKEYVDAATHRLSAALREHLGNIVAEAVRLVQPAPGLLRRLYGAIRNEPAHAPAAANVRPRPRNGVSPDQVATVGAVAARAVFERGED